LDSKSLEMLEFRQICEIVAGFTSFSASRELALNLQPLSDYEQISLLLDTEDATKVITELAKLGYEAVVRARSQAMVSIQPME